MPKAEKLSSGNWRARAIIGKDKNGKYVTKSITRSSRYEAERDAEELERIYKGSISKQSVGYLVEEFLQMSVPILSPSTMHGYTAYAKILKERYSEFWNMDLPLVTTSDVQKIVNDMALSGKKRKTIQNYVDFISLVFRQNGKVIEKVRLPRKSKTDLNIPDEKLVEETIKAAKGTELYVPVLLAVFGPMRRGEICALKKADVNENKNTIHVCRNLAGPYNGRWIEKPPKTKAGDRFLVMPDFVMDEIKLLNEDDRGHLIHVTNPNMLTDKFDAFLKKNNLPHYRFHDLRHASCSLLHSYGIPDSYIIARSGHESSQVLREIYTHTLPDQNEIHTREILDHFNRVFDEALDD